MTRALLTDLYELNMAASYLRRGMDGPATFSLFVRRLPAPRGYLVAAGLDDALAWLEELRFEEPELAQLATLGFGDVMLERLARLRFTGDVWAVPEGRIVLAGEPLLEVTAPLPEAQLAETFLLNQLTFQTALATKAARCRVGAQDRFHLVEFGFRRTQGVDAGLAVARLAVLVGFIGTSNVEAARRFGLEPMGTMAHSYIEAFPTELEAFRTFATDLPERTTFLVDTYDTRQGVRNAIRVITELGLERRAGVRIDSGDLVELSRLARGMLDDAGLSRVRVFVSGGLDEYDLERLASSGAPIDAAGVGTRLGVSADAPYLDSVYKLVDYEGRPVVKLSAGKSTLPGAKQVFRGPARPDLLGLRDEPAPAGTHPLLEEVMAGGRRCCPPAGLAAGRDRFETDLAWLPEDARRLANPRAPTPELSDDLTALTTDTYERAARQEAMPGVPGG